jgi:hypothetical protein
MSTIAKLARLMALDAEQRAIFGHSLVLLPLTALGLRLMGLRRVQAMLIVAAKTSAATPCAAEMHMRAKRAARVVAAAARHGPYRASCLPISLTLQRLLRWRGIETDLRLGVRKIDGRLEAHAWLEHGGVPLGDDRDIHERYAAFDRSTASARTGRR